jgi:outer membrane lipoprotein carrier protein
MSNTTRVPSGIVAGCLLVASSFGADTELSRTLQTVEKHYNSLSTLQVVFREEHTSARGLRRVVNGTLILSRGGRMRWDYSQPKGQIWVCDGKRVSIYSPKENRVEQCLFKESDDWIAPLGFLLGKLHFDKEFHNVRSYPEPNGIGVVAEPKIDNLPYSQVEFVISAQNQIRQVRVTGFDKSILSWNFDQERTDLPVDAKLFQFKMPPGVTVAACEQ